MHGFLLGIQNVFSFPAMLYLMGGVIGGLAIGALPGFTSTMGMVVLLPITFALSPIEGLLMLIGVYVGGIAGGCIPAIALGIPGTPASAATVFDGFPLFRKGHAEEALGIGIVASFIGGSISAIILMFLAPPIASFALRFGPAEYFALGILGMTLIISVSGSSMLKGLFAGLIGAFFAMIGVDSILGLPRFTFGNSYLAGGISYVPALIGLFGFSDVIDALLRGSKLLQPKNTTRFGIAKVPRKTLLHILPTCLRSGILGTLVGAIPGAGADIAAFLSYDVEKRLSKNPSLYGKGEPRGIAAPEAGNNADAGGAMIPMSTFGIPGDAQTAVLIGGLMLQGLRPGPLLFQEQPDIIWSIFVGLLVAQFIMLFFGLLSAPLAVKIVAQPPSILFPLIGVICIVGAFALANSIFDIWIMLIFGIVGYFLKRADIPVIPIVLAMILMPMVEGELRRALILAPKGFISLFSRPIFSILIGVAILSILSSLFIQWKSQKRESLKRE